MKEVCKLCSAKEEALRLPGKDRKLSEASGMAPCVIMELGICTLGELGSVTGRDVTTLNSWMKRLHIRAQTDMQLIKATKVLFKAVSQNCNIASQSLLEAHGKTDCGVVSISTHLSALSSATRTRLTL